MTTPNHALRNHVRRWLAAAALALLSVGVQAAAVGRSSGAIFTHPGPNTAKATFTNTPTGPKIFSVSGGKPTITMPAAGSAWNKFMANVRAQAEPAELAKSISQGRGVLIPAIIAGTAVGLLVEAACTRMLGGTLVQGTVWEECNMVGGSVLEYSHQSIPFPAPYNATTWHTSREAACQEVAGLYKAWQVSVNPAASDGAALYWMSGGGASCNVTWRRPDLADTYPVWQWGATSRSGTGMVQDGWKPSTATAAEAKIQQKIQEYCDAGDQKCADVAREFFDIGGVVEVGDPVIEGPASSPPEVKTENKTRTVQNPDGSTTTLQITNTTTTTTNYTYNGDTVNRQQITTTVTTTHNPDTGQTTTETEISDKPPPENERCAGGSDSLECAKLDAPTAEVPTKEFQITYNPDNLGFGAGGCPAPVSWTDSLGTHTIPFTGICDVLSSVIRPLVLLMASLAALFIVLPRES